MEVAPAVRASHVTHGPMAEEGVEVVPAVRDWSTAGDLRMQVAQNRTGSGRGRPEGPAEAEVLLGGKRLSLIHI